MSAPDPDLCHALALLVEKHGTAVVLAMRDACAEACQFEKAVGNVIAAELFEKAAGALDLASSDIVGATNHGGVSLDAALTVLSEADQ